MQKTLCFLILFLALLLFHQSFSQNVKWARNPKGTDFDCSDNLVTDKNGTTYLGGYYRSPSLDFGNVTLFNSGGIDTFGTTCHDAFVAKIDSNSIVIYARSFGEHNYNESIKGVAYDSAGNTYVTGWFSSPSFHLDTIVLHNSGGWDYFVAKLDTAGNVVWAKSGHGSSDDIGTNITVDPFGNVIVTGYFYSSPFILDTVSLSASSADVFIVKYDSDGHQLWAKKAGGGGLDIGNSVDTDPSGNIYLAGQFASGNMSFGNHTLSTSGNSDVFVVKYAPDGHDIWAVKGGGSKMDHCWSIKTWGYNGFAITGGFCSSVITFGTHSLTNAQVNTFDVYVVRYDSAGVVQWAKKAGMAQDDIGRGISFDTSGNVYVIGDFISRSLSFGDTNSVNNTDTTGTFSDVFVASFDNSGNVRWIFNGKDQYNDNGYSISNDHFGNTYITGTFDGLNILLSPQTIGNTGVTDIFYAKMGLESGPPIGIKNISQQSFNLYPNPASNYIWLCWTDDNMIKTIVITDILGRIIRSFPVEVGKTKAYFALTGMDNGIYNINLLSSQRILSQKLIIIK